MARIIHVCCMACLVYVALWLIQSLGRLYPNSHVVDM